MIKGSGRPVVNLGWAQKIQDTEDADKYSYGCLKCGETVTKAYKQASIGQAFHGKGGKIHHWLDCPMTLVGGLTPDNRAERDAICEAEAKHMSGLKGRTKDTGFDTRHDPSRSPPAPQAHRITASASIGKPSVPTNANKKRKRSVPDIGTQQLGVKCICGVQSSGPLVVCGGCSNSQHIACIGEETSSKNDYRCRSCTERSNAQSILQNAERVPPELLNGLAEAAEERRRRKYLAFDGFSVKPANSFSHRTGFPDRSDTESWPLLASPSEYAYQQCGISESRSTLRPEDIVQVEDQPPHKTVNDSLSPPSSSEGSLPREPQEFRSSREPGYKHTPPSHARDLLPLITGKDYYSENGPWSCLSSHDQVSLSCEHCSRAVRLSWQTGPSGRKLLCGDCGPMWSSLAAPRLVVTNQDGSESDASDDDSLGQDESNYPTTFGNLRLVPSAPAEMKLAIRPFLKPLAPSAPKQPVQFPRKPAPRSNRTTLPIQKSRDPLVAFLNSLNPGLGVTASVLRKHGIESKDDLERMHPLWWPDFFKQELRGHGLKPFDEMMLKTAIYRYLKETPV